MAAQTPHYDWDREWLATGFATVGAKRTAQASAPNCWIT